LPLLAIAAGDLDFHQFMARERPPQFGQHSFRRAGVAYHDQRMQGVRLRAQPCALLGAQFEYAGAGPQLGGSQFVIRYI
jgi:hypothetical protein